MFMRRLDRENSDKPEVNDQLIFPAQGYSYSARVQAAQALPRAQAVIFPAPWPRNLRVPDQLLG